MNEYILIVDDQPAIRLLLKEILQEAGYTAECVNNGWECLKIAFSANKPSLILLDYHMPKMNGIEVLSMLKENKTTGEIPVIMITGTEGIENKAKSVGAYEVLLKPLDNTILTQTIDQILLNRRREYYLGISKA